MKILAMDTSTWALAVGLVEDGQLLGEINTHIPKNHSLRLMPAIEDLCQQVDVSPQQLDGIVVAHGPGSYTGVRIGVMTAKSMAWSLGIPLLGISSLQVIAHQARRYRGRIIPMFDARREQVYTGMYTCAAHSDQVVPVVEERLQPVGAWLDELAEEDQPLLMTGQAHVYAAQIAERLGKQIEWASATEVLPKGGQLADLGYKMWAHRKDAHEVQPHYLQLAEAEQKWLAQQRNT